MLLNSEYLVILFYINYYKYANTNLCITLTFVYKCVSHINFYKILRSSYRFHHLEQCHQLITTTNFSRKISFSPYTWIFFKIFIPFLIIPSLYKRFKNLSYYNDGFSVWQFVNKQNKISCTLDYVFVECVSVIRLIFMHLTDLVQHLVKTQYHLPTCFLFNH